MTLSNKEDDKRVTRVGVVSHEWKAEGNGICAAEQYLLTLVFLLYPIPIYNNIFPNHLLHLLPGQLQYISGALEIQLP